MSIIDARPGRHVHAPEAKRLAAIGRARFIGDERGRRGGREDEAQTLDHAAREQRKGARREGAGKARGAAEREPRDREAQAAETIRERADEDAADRGDEAEDRDDQADVEEAEAELGLDRRELARAPCRSEARP